MSKLVWVHLGKQQINLSSQNIKLFAYGKGLAIWQEK
jgi:hypothetical protein